MTAKIRSVRLKTIERRKGWPEDAAYTSASVMPHTNHVLRCFITKEGLTRDMINPELYRIVAPRGKKGVK